MLTLSVTHLLIVGCHLLLVVQWAAGITVTSSRGIVKLASLDLTSNLQAYLDHEGVRLKVIAGDSRYSEEEALVRQRLKELTSIHQELLQNQTATSGHTQSEGRIHPTSTLVLVRNFLHVWQDKLTNTTLYGERLVEFLKRGHDVTFPTRDDLYRSAAVISFLQRFYNLSKDHLVQGQVMGHQGSPLTPADCYEIGRVSAEARLAEDTREWMEMALTSTDLSDPTKVTSNATFNVTGAIVLMARSLMTQEKKDEAVALLEKATEIEPDNLKLTRLYIGHRFGRQVDTIPPVTVEPRTQKFFDLCSNLTLGKAPKPLGQGRPVSGLRCRYRYSRHVPYWRYGEEVLSLFPYVSLVHRFVSHAYIDSLLNTTHGQSYKEEPLPGNRHGQMWQSKSLTYPDFTHRLISDVSKRVSYVTGLGIRQRKGLVSLGEPVHMIDFGPGGTYLPHRDIKKTYHHRYVGLSGIPRLATFHIFLSDPEVGGHMVFPELNITIEPRKGMSVFVYNFKPNGQPESNLLTGICPVLVGQNQVLQKGLFTSRHDRNGMCGPKRLSTHIGRERSLGCVAGPCGAPNTYK